MISLYLDEDVTERLADALSNLGIDVLSANRDHKGLDDPHQLLVAIGFGRAFVTYNTSDYLLLHQAWHAWSDAWDLRSTPNHRGILLIHSAQGYDVPRLAQVIHSFLSHLSTDAELDSRAFAWNPRRGWHEV
ncbi:MAG: DUF5615 family PIN-like protein [Thermomicrobiales bacterium]